MTFTEKQQTAREEWLTLENQWMEAHIKTRDLREKADKARTKFAAVLTDEMHVEQKQKERTNGIDTRPEAADRN